MCGAPDRRSPLTALSQPPSDTTHVSVTKPPPPALPPSGTNPVPLPPPARVPDSHHPTSPLKPNNYPFLSIYCRLLYLCIVIRSAFAYFYYHPPIQPACHHATSPPITFVYYPLTYSNPPFPFTRHFPTYSHPSLMWSITPSPYLLIHWLVCAVLLITCLWFHSM